MPDFTKGQLDAVEYRAQDACIVAGPGSGKTTVLVERYRRLIEDHNFRVEQILAITFTEKAAANMKSKLASQFETDPRRRSELESAWVSTIHGFCARLLKQNAVAAGVDPRFMVFDERQADRLQRECLYAAVNRLTETRREETLDLIKALHRPDITGPLQGAYDAIRCAGMTVEEVRAMASPATKVEVSDVIATAHSMLSCWGATTVPQRTQLADLQEWVGNAPRTPTLAAIWHWVEECPAKLPGCPRDHKDTLRHMREVMLDNLIATAADREFATFRDMVFDVLARFDAHYRERKDEVGALDFNDLESRTIYLLRNSLEVRKRYSQQFRQIMLDEFQDINDQQWKLLELLRAPDTFFAVGDINQSIYGFRHANPDIFERYQNSARGKHYVELVENFRSRPQILSCVEDLLNKRDGIQTRKLIAGKEFREKPGPFIHILKAVAEDKSDAAELEARWIAHQLLITKAASNLEYSGFAVLVRTGDGMRPILKAFRDAAIPHVSSWQDSFLISRAGHDITALLHVINNPHDEVHLMTVLRSPLVGVSDEALLRLRLAHHSLSDGLPKYKTASLDGTDTDKLQHFHPNLLRWRHEQPILPLDLLLVRALGDCGFEWTPGSETGADVESYLHLARTTGTELALPEFLEEVGSLAEAKDKEAELSDDDQGNRVQVLTAHAAKGLEFPVVFVAAMEKEGRHGTGAINFTMDHGLGIRWRSPDNGRDGIKDGWHMSNGESVKAREKAESNRLLYVAMTRAEDQLFLSYSATPNRNPSEWAALVEGHYGLKIGVNRTDPSVDVRITTAEPPRVNEFDVQQSLDAGIPALSRPAITGQSDSVVTVTALAVFAQCPRKYYLQRVAGARGGRFLDWDPEALPETNDESDDLPAAELGTLTHNLLAGLPADYPAAAQRLAAVFTDSDLGNQAAASTNAQREWEFIVQIEGVLVRGVIDLWFERDAETIIVDYKTDYIKPEHVLERAKSYAPQLAFYAMALKRSMVRGWLHFLQPDEQVAVALDEKALNNARKLVRDLAQAQETLDFPLNIDEHCKRCPYWRGQCPSGRNGN